MNNEQQLRDSRHILLLEVGIKNQQRLLDAKALSRAHCPPQHGTLRQWPLPWRD